MKQTDRQTDRQTERETETECVCVCVCVWRALSVASQQTIKHMTHLSSLAA